ncbi:uncharacterized protein LOC130994326 [Salvia miltiorrhiza]|uniref:uncharacterized protein LOC130994326 n=1 Tax=Salvia miltiorrhiza TaxID=226208 RepID=UPI0025AD8008|nr:uncharacterized protein LOC130994326 [Salvia miltiorrhiza]
MAGPTCGKEEPKCRRREMSEDSRGLEKGRARAEVIPLEARAEVIPLEARGEAIPLTASGEAISLTASAEKSASPARSSEQRNHPTRGIIRAAESSEQRDHPSRRIFRSTPGVESAVTSRERGMCQKQGILEDEYIEKKIEGNLKSHGPKGTTLLESALEKEEHRGRLRGIGGQVSKTMYFKIPRGKRCNINVCSQQELNEEKKKNAERDARIAKLEAYVYKTGVDDIDIDEKGSCSVQNENQTLKPVFNDIVEDNDIDVKLLDDDDIYLGKFVELSVESGKNVGTGTVVKVYGPNDKLYKRCMRVVIDEAIHEDARLPYPTEDYESIGDAVGSHVEWPIRLFKLRYEKPKKEKAQENNQETIDITPLPKSLRMLYIYGKRSGNNHITIELDDNVFGVKHNLYVDMEDIVPFCELKPISYMCIATYVW